MTYQRHQLVGSSAGVFGLSCDLAVEMARDPHKDFSSRKGCSTIQCLCGAEDEPDHPVFPLRPVTMEEEERTWTMMDGLAAESLY